VKVVLSLVWGTLECRNYQNFSGDCTIDLYPTQTILHIPLRIIPQAFLHR